MIVEESVIHTSCTCSFAQSHLCLQFQKCHFPRPNVAKQIGGNLAHLDLLRALRDSVSAMMAIDVFKRLMPAVTYATVNLNISTSASQH